MLLGISGREVKKRTGPLSKDSDVQGCVGAQGPWQHAKGSCFPSGAGRLPCGPHAFRKGLKSGERSGQNGRDIPVNQKKKGIFSKENKKCKGFNPSRDFWFYGAKRKSMWLEHNPVSTWDQVKLVRQVMARSVRFCRPGRTWYFILRSMRSL